MARKEVAEKEKTQQDTKKTHTYQVLRPIAVNGTRLDKGSKVQLTREEANAYGAQYLKKVS